MLLASILRECKDEVICDLAEYYHIYDYRGLLPNTVATLVFGLRADSRTKMKLSGQKITLEQMLMAMQVDTLQLLLWTKTKDGQKNRNRPKSLLNKLLGNEEVKQKDELMSFATIEEYETYMRSKRV